ncbi:hypothetical protein PYV00_09215 [Novosphingobium sp. H3SJ31-1]|uniref:Twin transmembrane helix small protein n=2 Tax=Novosphingobium album (ex Liu et al. 2023) TaxID=3031130 RepID=A0ABT5WSC1_9SPHN|nr:hypothetical protein [Novosphingobium album (ex Liu et al. 2023)]
MSTGAMIVAIVGVLGALFLAWRGLQAQGLSVERKVRMATIWLAIIVGLVLVIQLTGLHLAS